MTTNRHTLDCLLLWSTRSVDFQSTVMPFCHRTKDNVVTTAPHTSSLSKTRHTVTCFKVRNEIEPQDSLLTSKNKF